jgi:O-antigen ligase
MLSGRAPFDEGVRSRDRTTALLVLQVFVWLLVLLPARLVIGQFGAFGQPASIVGLCAFGLWAAGAARPGLLVRTVVPVRIAMVAVWIPGLISFAVMHLHSVTGDEVNSADRWVLYMLVWTGVALLAAEGLRDREDVLRLLRVAVAGSAFSAAVAIAQNRGFDLTKEIAKLPGLDVAGVLDSVLTRSGLRRPAGTATHPIEFGCMLGMALGPALVLATHDKVWPALRRWGALALIGLGIPISVSRSAIVGSGIAGAFWFVAASVRERLRALSALACFISVVFLTTPGLLGTLHDYFSAVGTDDSITTRTDDYAAVAKYIRESPVIGRGPATFLPKYRILDNQWLGSIIEVGVLGVIGLAVLYLTPAFLGRSMRRASRDPMTRGLGQAFAGLSFVVAIGSTTFDFYAYPMDPGFLSVYLGIAGALWAIQRETNAAELVAHRQVTQAGPRPP